MGIKASSNIEAVCKLHENNKNRPLKIGYQGELYSNSHAAASKFTARIQNKMSEFNNCTPHCHSSNIELVPLVTSKNVMKAVASGDIDLGVCAVVNSKGGIVQETVNALQGHNVNALSTMTVPLRHHLFAKTLDRSKIHLIASHPQALKQCQRSLRSLFDKSIPVRPVKDTAIAARYLKEGTLDDDTAVLCTEEAGKYYGLKLLAKNISDATNNQTTFMLFSNHNKQSFDV